MPTFPPKREVLSGEQNHRCCYCGIAMAWTRDAGDSLTIDHVEPVAYGGARSWENEVAACWLCNNARGDLNAIAFFYMIQKLGPYSGRRAAMQMRRRRGDGVWASALRARGAKLSWLADPNEKDRGTIAASNALLAKRGLLPDQSIRAPQLGEPPRHSKRQRALVGHDVQLGQFRSLRLPKKPTPARPIEGASLATLWPDRR